jgi:hypothetical protein
MHEVWPVIGPCSYRMGQRAGGAPIVVATQHLEAWTSRPQHGTTLRSTDIAAAVCLL